MIVYYIIMWYSMGLVVMLICHLSSRLSKYQRFTFKIIIMNVTFYFYIPTCKFLLMGHGFYIIE